MKKKGRRALSGMLCVLILLFALCACASEPRPERVPDEELALLREQYPYHDAESSMGNHLPYETVYPTFERLGSLQFYAALVIECSSDWYMLETYVSPFGGETSNARLPQTNIQLLTIDATVEEILWGGEELSTGETITLGYGTTAMVSGKDLQGCIMEGNRYVVLVVDYRDNPYGAENLFNTGKFLTYYPTDQNVLLSVTSVPGADECSGMYVDAFARKAQVTFTQADAQDATSEGAE